MKKIFCFSHRSFVLLNKDVDIFEILQNQEHQSSCFWLRLLSSYAISINAKTFLLNSSGMLGFGISKLSISRGILVPDPGTSGFSPKIKFPSPSSLIPYQIFPYKPSVFIALSGSTCSITFLCWLRLLILNKQKSAECATC